MNPDIKSPNGTDLLCKNIAETKFEQLSEENIRILKDRVLDIIGCIFGGAIVPEDQFLIEKLKEWGGKEEAPLFARSGKLPLPNAVMANCITARANDYGNMFFYVLGDRIASHCGETLIPMGLTLSAVQKTSGKEFITNNIAAEDAVARILYTLPKRWPTDMLMVSSAAAALASRYCGFDASQTKAALSYAATNATDPGNCYYDYSQEFKYHNGASAQMGIMACEIVKGGWTGFKDPYFGHWGLVCMQLPKKDGSEMPALYEKAFEGLGQVYFTEQSFKRSPGGIPTSAAGTCGKEIRRQMIEKYGDFKPEDIRGFHLYRSSKVNYNYYSEPFVRRNHTNALFSFQFAACCALLYGNVSVKYVQTKAIRENPYLVSLAEESTMDVFEDPQGRQLFKMVLEMKDGTVFETVQSYSAEMHTYPTREFLVGKFWDQFDAFGKLPKAVGEKIVETCGRLEQLDDMRELTDLLVLSRLK